MKKRNKILLIMILTIIIVTGIFLYNNFKIERDSYIVTLNKSNSTINVENNITTIQRYAGSADTIIIDKQELQAEKLEIKNNAFLECGNLDKILIDKAFDSEIFETENFKINKESKDEKYVEYKNTQKLSASYEQYQQLSDKEKSKLEIIP